MSTLFTDAFKGMPAESQRIGCSFLFVDRKGNEVNAMFAGDYPEATERFLQHDCSQGYQEILDCAEFEVDGTEVEGPF